MERIVHNILKTLLVICFTVSSISLSAQDVQKLNNPSGIDISAGLSFLLYQSGYGFNSIQGLDVLVSKQLGNTIKAEAGFRTSFGTFLSEGFIRGVVYNKFNWWQPVIGIEIGITKRADFENSTNLMKETRDAMLKDLGYFYFSTHLEWLSLSLFQDIKFSFLELDIGTHFEHFGRTLRAQTTLIKITKTL